VALIPSEIIKKAHLNNIKKKQKQLNIDHNAFKIASKNQVMTPQQQLPISLFELNENGDQKDSMLPLSNILES